MSATGKVIPDVMVSVAMITYNHERFIAQAVESVLMQETDFPVEIVIGEDCSTDGTRAIVAEYARRNPDRIRLLLPKHNVGMIHNFVATLEACRNKYVALLEGDDYWTDPRKLQKQVDFLETHRDHAICFHRTCQLVQTTGEVKNVHPRHRLFPKRTYTLNDIVRMNFIPTASVLFRNRLILKPPDWYFNAPAGDWPLFVLLAEHGKIGFINQTMSVWRIHDGGVWSGADEIAKHELVIRMFEILQTHLGTKFETQIKAGVSDHWLGMAANSADRGDVATARVYLLRSITGCPLNPDMRILDKLALLARLYIPSVYRASKRFQISLSSPFKS